MPKWFMSILIGWAVGVLLTFFLLCTLAIFGVGQADAHTAPAGWKYDQVCCSDQDCTPVTKMEFKPDGSSIAYTKMFKPITIKQSWWKRALKEKRLRPSKDSSFHICAYQYPSGSDAKSYGHYIRCLYTPAGG